MKKLITILAILVVLVGAIFASTSESHQIKITVTIAAEIPAFQLKLNSANSNSTGVQFGNAPSTKADATPVAVTIDFESDDDDDRIVVVDASIANAAKQNKVYTLTFSDGVFKDAEEHTVVSPVNNGITAIEGSGDGYGTGVSTAVNGAVATVTFNGTQRCVANTLIAQAKYQYPKANIAPGTYTADIIMTISTT